MGRRDASFKDITTLRVGGPIAEFHAVESPEELRRRVLEADGAARPLVVVGSGSNLLASDDPFAGTVVKCVCAEAPQARRAEDGVHVSAPAGCVWDDLVAWCVERGLSGLEALSGIPGQLGSAVMQNLGAYGQEVGACLVSAALLDRARGTVEPVSADRLALGYRTSILRRSMEDGVDGRTWAFSPRWVVLEAEFALSERAQGLVGHAQLARALGCEPGCEMDLGQIRDSVYQVRASKGMVADPDPCGPSPIHDRWSSGSFFTNPVLARDEAARKLPSDAPLYPAGDEGLVKTSAAWLIERAGFPKGWGVHGPDSRATLSRLHTLAMTNRGQATSADVVELAQAVKDGVRVRFGVELKPETVLVGAELH